VTSTRPKLDPEFLWAIAASAALHLLIAILQSGPDKPPPPPAAVEVSLAPAPAQAERGGSGEEPPSAEPAPAPEPPPNPEPSVPEPEVPEPEVPEPKVPEPKVREPEVPEPKVPEPKVREPEPEVSEPPADAQETSPQAEPQTPEAGLDTDELRRMLDARRDEPASGADTQASGVGGSGQGHDLPANLAGRIYFRELVAAIQQAWRVPPAQDPQPVKMVVLIAADGSLLESHIQASSGDQLLDRSARAAVKSARLPAPPNDFRTPLRLVLRLIPAEGATP